MSIQAVAWVLEHSEATLADRLVLIAIANHADAKGWNAYPAVPLIAREARVDARTVYRAIEALEELGELTVNRRKGRSSIYGISALMGCQDVRGGGWQDVRGGSHPVRGTPGKLPPEPSLAVTQPAPTVGFPDRCAVCGHFQFDCRCDEIVDKERAKEWIQAIKRGDRPA